MNGVLDETAERTNSNEFKVVLKKRKDKIAIKVHSTEEKYNGPFSESVTCSRH